MTTNYLCAMIGLALVGATGTAHAQTVITREVANPPVDTIVTPATTTVITRQPATPIATVAAQPSQTVETIRTTRPTRVVSRQGTKHITGGRKSARTIHHSARRVTLTPAQQHTISRVIRRERVIPAQTITERIVTTPARRVVTAPAYPATTTYVAPPYTQPAYTEVVPASRYDEWDDYGYETHRYSDRYDVPPAEVAAAPPVAAPAPITVERVVTQPAEIVVGAPLPATVPVYAMPPTAVARVPNASAYRYAYVNDQILLVDPNTNIVLATLQQ
jgi:hypothetical protein